jgi:hypothetical protein
MLAKAHRSTGIGRAVSTQSRRRLVDKTDPTYRGIASSSPRPRPMRSVGACATASPPCHRPPDCAGLVGRSRWTGSTGMSPSVPIGGRGWMRFRLAMAVASRRSHDERCGPEVGTTELDDS